MAVRTKFAILLVYTGLGFLLVAAGATAESTCTGEEAGGLTWPSTSNGKTVVLACLSGFGNISRRCNDAAIWGDVNAVGCSSGELVHLKTEWSDSNQSASPEFVESLLTVGAKGIRTSGELLDLVGLIEGIMASEPLNGEYGTGPITAMIENIMRVVDISVNSDLKAEWDNVHRFQSNAAFLTFLERIRDFSGDVLSFLSKNNRTSLRIELSHIVAHYEVQNRSSATDFAITMTSANVTIPKSAYNKNDNNGFIGVAVVQYHENVKHILPPSSVLPSVNLDTSAITSALLCVSQYPSQSPKPLQEHQIQIILQTSLTNLTSCGLMNFSSSDSLWNDNVCTVDRIQGDEVYCKCTKLSVYAVIDTVPRSLPSIVLAVLVLTEILLWVTMLMLLYANRRFESDRALVVKLFLLTMSATHITLMAGLYSVHNQDACTAVALLLHFFELSEAFWLLGMVVQLVLKVTYKTTDSGSVSQFMALGWITPLFVVASTAGLEITQYGTEYYCFLNIEDDIFFAFAVPAALTVGTSFVCLIYLSYTYFMIRKKNRKAHRRLIIIYPNLRACLVVNVTLVLDWLATTLSLTFYGPVTMSFFAILKFTEALLIFLLFGVFSSEVRHEYEKRYGRCWPNRRKKMNNERPETNDELSQIRESSVIHDLDSTISSTGPLSAYNRAPSSMSTNGGYNFSSSTASLRKADLNGNSNGSNPFITRGHDQSNGGRSIVTTTTNSSDGNAGTSGVAGAESPRTSPQESTPMATFKGLSLKHKMKVFPLMKHDEERESSSTA